MSEHEEYLTIEDLKYSKNSIDDELDDNGLTVDDIERINKNSKTDKDSEKISKTSLIDKDEIVGYFNDKPVFKNDDNYYKVPENNLKNLLENVSEKEKYYLKTSTLVRKDQKKFRQGFTLEEAVVTRVQNEDGKWPTHKGLKRYMAMNSFKFAYTPKDGQQRIVFNMNQGDVFLAPQSAEDNEKKRKNNKT